MVLEVAALLLRPLLKFAKSKLILSCLVLWLNNERKTFLSSLDTLACSLVKTQLSFSFYYFLPFVVNEYFQKYDWLIDWLIDWIAFLMLYAACSSLNQSSESQDLGRYLGFRLRCLDVNSSSRSPPAAAAGLCDVSSHLSQCPHDDVDDHTGSSFQSPEVVSALSRRPDSVDLSPCGHRGMTSLSRSLKRNDAEAINRWNIIVNSWTDPISDPRDHHDPLSVITRDLWPITLDWPLFDLTHFTHR